MNRTLLQLIIFTLITFTIQNFAYAFQDPFNTENHTKKFQINNCDDSTSYEDSQGLGVNQLINIALCNNPEIRTSWSTLLADQNKLGAGYSEYLPKLSASSNYTKFRNEMSIPQMGNFTSVGSQLPVISGTGEFNANSIVMSYLLYDFGKREANIEALKQNLESMGYAHSTLIQNIVFTIVEKYYTYLSFENLLSARIKSESLAKKILEYTKARQQAGLAKKLDLLQATSSYSRAKIMRTDTEKKLQIVKVQLLLEAGLNPSKQTKIKPSESNLYLKNSDSIFKKSIDELLEIAQANNPELKKAYAELKSNQANWSKAKTLHYPTLSAFGSANRDINISGLAFNRSYRAIGLSLSIPIFTGFSDTYSIDAAKHQRNAAASAIDSARKTIITNVWSAYNDFELSLQNIELSNDLLKVAEETEQQAREGYNVGANNILDVTTAQSQLALAEEENIAAKYQSRTAMMRLLKAIGAIDIK